MSGEDNVNFEPGTPLAVPSALLKLEAWEVMTEFAHGASQLFYDAVNGPVYFQSAEQYNAAAARLRDLERVAITRYGISPRKYLVDLASTGSSGTNIDRLRQAARALADVNWIVRKDELVRLKSQHEPSLRHAYQLVEAPDPNYSTFLPVGPFNGRATASNRTQATGTPTTSNSTNPPGTVSVPITATGTTSSAPVVTPAATAPPLLSRELPGGAARPIQYHSGMTALERAVWLHHQITRLEDWGHDARLSRDQVNAHVSPFYNESAELREYCRTKCAFDPLDYIQGDLQRRFGTRLFSPKELLAAAKDLHMGAGAEPITAITVHQLQLVFESASLAAACKLSMFDPGGHTLLHSGSPTATQVLQRVLWLAYQQQRLEEHYGAKAQNLLFFKSIHSELEWLQSSAQTSHGMNLRSWFDHERQNPAQTPVGPETYGQTLQRLYGIARDPNTVKAMVQALQAIDRADNTAFRDSIPTLKTALDQAAKDKPAAPPPLNTDGVQTGRVSSTSPREAPTPAPPKSVTVPTTQESKPMSSTKTTTNNRLAKIGRTMKSDVKSAAVNITARQMAKAARVPFAAVLAAKFGGKSRKTQQAILAFLNTPEGLGVMKMLLGTALAVSPLTKYVESANGSFPDNRLAQIADILRMEGMADVGDSVTDLITGPLMEHGQQFLTSILELANAPAELEDEPEAAQPTKSRTRVRVGSETAAANDDEQETTNVRPMAAKSTG